MNANAFVVFAMPKRKSGSKRILLLYFYATLIYDRQTFALMYVFEEIASAFLMNYNLQKKYSQLSKER